ncbi:MAG: T9SS type A sorting domain-containing protein [Patiriisocius sp.]|uniref:T9SS type A sorting domain-containing protein n=1 Tax=Patiriisocius sp. TaxID=2822396 RepID=UPI003EF265E1
MKKITLLMMLFTIGILGAQTTHDIVWTNGAGTSGEATKTIETGDTVRWTWGNTAGHDIFSSDPDAPADFGTGIISQQGFVYEYTFTEEAVIDYICTPHSGNMFGTITVIDALSTQDKFATNLNYFPNPVNDKMTITSLYELDSYEVYSVLGKKIMQKEADGNFAQIDMSNLNSGLYLVTAISGDFKTTFKVIKN